MTEINAGKRKRQRNKKARAKKRHRKAFLITGGALLCIILIVGIILVIKGNVYHDQEGFEKYSDTYFTETSKNEVPETSKLVGSTKTVIRYGEPCSTAVEYPVLKDKDMEKRMGMAIDNIVKRFKNDHTKAEEKEQYALFLRAKVYASPKKVISLAVYEERQGKDGRKMVSQSTDIHTYNYYAETGIELVPNQIFYGNYKAFFSKYMIDHFKDSSAKDLEKGKYKKSLAPAESNFNKFVLTDHSAKFFFDSGAVLKKEEGDVAVDVNYKLLEGVIRKEVLVRYIDPNKPMVALTYDDGPFPGPENRIVDCLKKHGAIATFFSLGKNVKNHPEVVEREAKLGMETGNHSWSHPDLGKASEKEIKKQIDKTNKALKEACGRTATVFRPPYGSTSKMVEKNADAPVILWSVDTLDWKSRKAKSIVKVVKGVKNLDGRVILMHSIYDSTAEATEKLVPWLLNEGYQLVTVSELLEYRYNEIPKEGKLYGYGYFYLDKGKKKN